MLRSLVCAASIFALLFTFFLMPQTASARRCPVRDPETLLSLYQNSDAIYVATFDKVTRGEVTDSNENYSVVAIQKHFTVSSALKGTSRKFFVVNDQEYEYKTVAAEPAAATSGDAEAAEEPQEELAEEEEMEEPADGLSGGDTVLLFVKDGTEEEGPTLTDFRDGVKPLSLDDLGVYEERIKELNSLFGKKKPSETQLLEWLIRCAENPATRWEGTFELLRSVQAEEWNKEMAERRRERLEQGLPVEEVVGEPNPRSADEEGEDEVAHKNFDTSVFAKILDAGHKQRLANILLDREADRVEKPDGEKPGYIAGDNELIELIKRWDDPRLIAFLLDRLRTGSDEAGTNADAMRTVSELLEDDDAAALSEKYQENAYEDGEDVVKPESEDAEKDEAEDVPAEKPENNPDEGRPETEGPEPALPADVNVEKDAPADEPKKQTYKELRLELLQRFVARCDKVIAEKERKKAEPEENISAR